MIARFDLTKLPLLIISFILSLGLYLYVQVQNTALPTPKTIGNVTVIPLHLPDGLSATLSPSSIDVKLSGPNSVIDKIGSSDIRATVDLSSVRAGNNKVRLNLNKPAGVDSISFPGTFIGVRVEPIVEESRRVIVNTKGTPSVEHYLYQTYAVLPTTVTLRGPKDIVDDANPVVTLELADAKPNKEYDLRVSVVTKTGVALDKLVQADPDVVRVSPLFADAPDEKTAVVDVNVIGNPAPGFKLGSFAPSSSTVRVTGDSAVLRKLNRVTFKVDITGLTADKTFSLKVDPVLPKGLHASTHDQSIQVQVQITPIAIPNAPGPG